MNCPHNFVFDGACSACGAPTACTTCRRGPKFCLCEAQTPARTSIENFTLRFAAKTPAIKYAIGGDTVLDLPNAAVFGYSMKNTRPEPSSASLSLGAIMDVSGSMHGGGLNRAKAALASFVGDIPIGDGFRPVEFELATFTTTYSPALFKGLLTVHTRPVLLQVIDSLRAEGGTNFTSTVETEHRMSADVILFTTDATDGTWVSRDRKLEDFFRHQKLILVDVGPTGTGFSKISNLLPLQGADAIERGLDTIREDYFNQECVTMSQGRFSGNVGGAKLWVGPGATRKGFFLLEGFDETKVPDQLLYNGTDIIQLEPGWQNKPNDATTMGDIARRRLHTLPDDYKAAIVRDADNVHLDQEFLGLARKSAMNDYHTDLGWEYFDAMGAMIQTIKKATLVQIADQERTGQKRRVIFEERANADDGSSSTGNCSYRRRATKKRQYDH